MKKSLGQNFLGDANILLKILEVIPKTYPILEIGTGSGILTRGLAQTIDHPIHSYEVDRATFDLATANLSAFPNVHLHLEDYLQAQVPLDEPHIVVANIPYYITTPIIEKCLQNPNIKAIYIMVQKEIANRIVAKAAASDYSSLSIFCQTRANVRRLFPVSRNCFFPRPAVDSAFIELIPTNERLHLIQDIKLYDDIIHSAFWGKRKTLINCLNKSPYLSIDKNHLIALFEALNIPGNIRGEDLEISQYIAVANKLTI